MSKGGDPFEGLSFEEKGGDAFAGLTFPDDKKKISLEPSGNVLKTGGTNPSTSTSTSKSVSAPSPNLEGLGAIIPQQEQRNQEAQSQLKELAKLNATMWRQKPMSNEIVASGRMNKAKPTIPVYEENPEYGQAKQAVDQLPPSVKTGILKDKELSQDVMDYLKDNPEQAQKLYQQSIHANSLSGKLFDNKDQSQWQNLNEIFTGMAEKSAAKLQEYQAAGIDKKYDEAVKGYGEIDKLIDEANKNQKVINFYQNQYLKQKGFEGLSTQAKQIKSNLNKFDQQGFTKLVQDSVQNVQQAEEQLKQYEQYPEGIPPELAPQYQADYQHYLQLNDQYNQLINSPEYKQYQSGVNQYNQVVGQQKEIISGLEKNPEYKKALEGYEKAHAAIEQMKPQLEEYQQLQPQFQDYAKTVNHLNNISNKLNFYKEAFTDVKDREQAEQAFKAWVDSPGFGGVAPGLPLGKVEDLSRRTLQGLATAFTKTSAGLASLTSEAYKHLGVENSKDYSVFEQAADLLNNWTEKSGYITSGRTALDKNGKIDPYGVVGSMADNIGNMGLAMLTGPSPAKNLFKSEMAQSGLSNMTSIARMAAAANQNAPMVTTFYLMSLTDRLKEADEAGLTGASRDIYAHTLSWLEGLSELIMPDSKMVTATVKNKLLKEAVKGVSEGAGWYRKQAIKEVLSNAGKETAEEFVVSLGEIANKTLANEFSGANFDLSEYKNPNKWVGDAIVASGLAGGLSTIGATKEGRLQKNADLYTASKYLTEARSVLDDMVSTGKLSAEKADETYSKLTRYAAVSSLIPEDISPEKAVQVVPIVEENKALQLQLQNASEEFAPGIREKIKSNIEKVQEILNQKEVDKNAEKVRSNKEIGTESGQTVENSGENRSSDLQQTTETGPEAGNEGKQVASESEGVSAPSDFSKVFDLIDEATRTKKTVKGKIEAATEAVKDMGVAGKKAIFVEQNFKDIVAQMKEQNTLKVECE